MIENGLGLSPVYYYYGTPGLRLPLSPQPFFIT